MFFKIPSNPESEFVIIFFCLAKFMSSAFCFFSLVLIPVDN